MGVPAFFFALLLNKANLKKDTRVPVVGLRRCKQPKQDLATKTGTRGDGTWSRAGST